MRFFCSFRFLKEILFCKLKEGKFWWLSSFNVKTYMKLSISYSMVELLNPFLSTLLFWYFAKTLLNHALYQRNFFFKHFWLKIMNCQWARLLSKKGMCPVPLDISWLFGFANILVETYFMKSIYFVRKVYFVD